MSSIAPTKPPDQSGPAWAIATLFSDQGHISEDEYLYLTRYTRKLVEFTDGFIEVLPMPTTSHQRIVLFLLTALTAWAEQHDGGLTLFAALRVRLRAGKIREPDIVYMKRENLHRVGEDVWEGADIVMEVVSPDGRQRDLVEKRQDYAEAGIPEYWIVDPQPGTVTVLRLENGRYEVHAEGAHDGIARSATLPGFEVNVAAVFAAAAAAGRSR